MFPGPLILCKRAGFHFPRCPGSLIMRLFHNDSIVHDLQIDFDLKSISSSSSQKVHKEEYPEVKKLHLSSSIKNLKNSEKTRFFRQRNRIISVACISAADSLNHGKIDNENVFVNDVRIGSYDCLALINLSSVMQTNVPYPFISQNETSHLSMPDGPRRQEEKYVSHELSSFHQTNAIGDLKITGKPLLCSDTVTMQPSCNSVFLQRKCFFSSEKKVSKAVSKNNSQDDVSLKQNVQPIGRQRLTAAIKEYGAIIIVMHIAISLVSLGFWYIAVTSGIDFQDLLKQWGMTEGSVAAGTAAPFVVAYAIHKLTAPARIAITLTSVPFIVKYFRKRKFTNKHK